MSRLPARRWPGDLPKKGTAFPGTRGAAKFGGALETVAGVVGADATVKIAATREQPRIAGRQGVRSFGARPARSCEAVAHGLAARRSRRRKRTAAPRREQSARQPWFRWLAPRAAGRRCLTEGVRLLDSRNAESCGISRSSAAFGAPLGSTVAAFVNCSAAPWCRVGGARGSRMECSPARCKRVREASAARFPSRTHDTQLGCSDEATCGESPARGISSAARGVAFARIRPPMCARGMGLAASFIRGTAARAAGW
jgi:hypothetical protein